MFLLITTSQVTNVNWWLKAIGCRNDVTRGQLQQWYTEGKKGVVRGSSPIIISGILSKVGGLVLGIIGLNKENKILEWSGILLAALGVGLSASGGVYTYNLISEAKNRVINKQKRDEDKILTIEQIIERDKGVRIQREESVDLAGEEIKNLIENEGILPEEENQEINDQISIKQALKDLQLLEEKIDTEKILSIVRRILNKCPKKQYKNISHEAYREIFEIGRKLRINVLSKALEDKDVRLRRWSMLCLLVKETKDAEEVLVSATKQPENMAIMISFTVNEKLQELTSKITEIIHKAAA